MVAPPLSGAETVLPASALPPGQQVVLQPVAGGAQQEPQSAQMTTSMPAAPQKASSKPLPFIVPRIHAVQGNTGSTLGSVTALGLQNGLLEPGEDHSGLLSEDSTPVIIKVESYSGDSSSKHPCSDQPEPEERSVHVKIEDDTDQSLQNSRDSSLRAKIEEPDHEAIADVTHHLNTSESTDRSVKDTDRSSSITEVQQHLRGREEMKDTTTGKRRRKRQAPDDPRVDSAAEVNQSSCAFMYSSDGWTTEDSNDWISEEEVDIETFEEYDEKMNISLLRARARRKTQQAAQSQWLLKCKSVGVDHHVVRLMSDLPLYKRTWRLNRMLRERKQLVELQQSLDSLKRMLGVEEDVMMSTQDLLREARQMIGALEEHNTSLMARKRALIRQHSHYQTLISQRSGADVTGTEEKTAAPSSPRSPAHSQSVLKRRLPGVILQSFTKT
ncbi:uncharacterized protein LOC109058821 [Cyprinus carpio]|uniref:Uncharacterized protein LOC109058821 n=1 Tax=Cyprinus carpio TaxID=7962 RepID=A0A9R0AV14_CYPCA|nr:uncharacterized protein LOC109058821 [Cyprinus carpio]